MNISLDYDDTFSRDHAFWHEFIELAKKHGHQVYCVTKREPNLGTPDLDIPTVYSSRGSKVVATHNQNVHIDIWIDDSPDGILFADGAVVTVERNR